MEVLVVVAIIGLLAGLLMTSLQAAQGKARRIHCTSNLRQMGIAAQVYVSDNQAYPLATAGDGLGNWQRALRTTINEEVLYCPQWIRATPEYLEYFPTNEFIFTHYGYNSLGAERVNPPAVNPGLGGNVIRAGPGVWNYVAARESWVAVPSQMVAFGDGPTFIRPPLVSNNLTPADPLYLIFPFVALPQNYDGVGNSHNGGSNMVFCDGHVLYGKQAWWFANTEESKRLWNHDNQSHPEFQ